LRRAKNGRVIEGEARMIRYAREHGYPVPEIYDVLEGGTEIVMERIEGPMMMDAMMRAPWRMPRYCRELADLHDRLHVIPAPEWLHDAGGDRLVHLDLHPMNVMLTESGPIVIDWTNAARGEPLLDVAVTFVLLTCPRFPGSDFINAAARPVRGALGSMFTKRYRGKELDRQLVIAAGLKALDKNLSEKEVAACERLGARVSARVER
jgi:aminoglycoside phosphotransferase (APT) family kinase protein